MSQFYFYSRNHESGCRQYQYPDKKITGRRNMLKLKKTFKNNYPNTTISMTSKGIKAFEEYVNDIKKIINPKYIFFCQ